MNNVRNVALSMALFVVSIGLVIAAASIFIATLTPLTIAVWLVTLLLAFLCGLCVWRVTAIKHEREQSQVIDVTPQLPEPRWVPTDTGYTRPDTLDAKAMHIGQLLRDRRLQPTRANIKAVGMEHGVNGNEAASMIYRRFVEWEWAEAVAQGQPGRWKNE